MNTTNLIIENVQKILKKKTEIKASDKLEHLGLNSMQMVQLIVRLEEQTQKNISLQSIEQVSTVEELALLCQEVRGQ